VLAVLTSLARDAELPEIKAAAVDDADDAAPAPLTLRTTRGDGFLSSRGGALLLLLLLTNNFVVALFAVLLPLLVFVAALARAAARTAEAAWGARVGRLSVGRLGCCVEAAATGADGACFDFGCWLALVAAGRGGGAVGAFLLLLLLLFLNVDGRFRAAAGGGCLGGGGAGFLEAVDEDAEVLVIVAVPDGALFMRAASSR